ncbi:MAG TPA: SprT family zinc-dependent metalloprotease [Steroidobacteraceae bacterium]|nr:SprT family zinc-dependent metalloprotease [Steroidobacteraceae bacterium]
MTDGHKAGESPQLALGLDEGAAAWHVRRSHRARRLTVRVYPGGRVEVVVPRGVGVRVVQSFVMGHSEWIARKVDEMRALAPPDRQRIPAIINLAAIGATFHVRHETSCRSSLRRAGDSELILMTPPADERAGMRLLQNWLRARARSAMGPWLARVAGETGIDFRRLEIRRQRTRWGSCSRQGVVSLNACLLFQRPEVVRYLVVHELCHRVHMNHSQRFWALVARHEPHFRTLDRELGQGWRHVPDWVFAA